MKYSFSNFQFDCEQKILTSDGQIVPLNDKAANILALFVMSDSRIITKDEILETVLADRVVTEQVVFQNISQLRGLFGNNAIKTFSKKGYQWQLPVIELTELATQHEQKITSSEKSNTDVDNPPPGKEKTPPSIKKISSTHIFALVSVLIITTLLSWSIFFSKTTANKQLKPSLVFHLNSETKSRKVIDELSPQHVFDTGVISWQLIQQAPSDLLIATRLHTIKNAVALQFIVQGQNRSWQDHIVADNPDQALHAFNILINEISDSQYFSIGSEHGALAQLNVLSHQLANNLLIQRKLLKTFIAIEQLSQANALLTDLENKSESTLEQALLLLAKNEIANKAKNWKLAKRSITQAIELFEHHGLNHLIARAYISASWGYIVEQNFREGMTVLNTAVINARKADQPLLEFEATAMQAYFSGKAGEIELAYAQLDTAKQLISLHDLGDENQALIYYFAAWIEQDKTKKVAAYESLLNTPFSAKYTTYYYSSAKSLRSIYLHQQAFDKAEATIKSWQSKSFQSISKAYINLAQKQVPIGLEFAELAFNQAQLDHSRYVALDAALLLIQLNSHLKQRAKAYIVQQATPRWLDQNPSGRDLINN